MTNNGKERERERERHISSDLARLAMVAKSYNEG